MSEEVTYAHLKFSEPRKTENIQEVNRFGTQAPPAASRIWHQTTLTLTLLCLLLLTGLGILGSIFYTTLKIDKGRLNKLQNVKEELQRNISFQLMTNLNRSENIRNLSITLQNLATKLCRELNRKEPGHKCKPCPSSWIWYKNNCYFLTTTLQTWQDSETSCSSQNASLLQIKEKSTLEFVKSQKLYYYWLGLSPRQDYRSSEEVDEHITSSARIKRSTNDINKMYCGYIYATNIFYIRCTEKQKIACEKKANPVKAESILMSEDSDGR
ncbi:C-type lectin domain family 12 member A, partial [Heterocephalus glaber]